MPTLLLALLDASELWVLVARSVDLDSLGAPLPLLLCCFMTYGNKHPRTPRTQVVLIGDGFAEGIGDWVVMGGMAGVTRLLENHAGSDEKVC